MISRSQTLYSYKIKEIRDINSSLAIQIYNVHLNRNMRIYIYGNTTEGVSSNRTASLYRKNTLSIALFFRIFRSTPFRQVTSNLNLNLASNNNIAQKYAFTRNKGKFLQQECSSLAKLLLHLSRDRKKWFQGATYCKFYLSGGSLF